MKTYTINFYLIYFAAMIYWKLWKKGNIILNDCLLTGFKKSSGGVWHIDLEHYEHLLLCERTFVVYFTSCQKISIKTG